jgi:hypothetical protein
MRTKNNNTKKKATATWAKCLRAVGSDVVSIRKHQDCFNAELPEESSGVYTSIGVTVKGRKYLVTIPETTEDSVNMVVTVLASVGITPRQAQVEVFWELDTEAAAQQMFHVKSLGLMSLANEQDMDINDWAAVKTLATKHGFTEAEDVFSGPDEDFKAFATKVSAVFGGAL